jgi:glucose-1-phosphate cytidylyltransferase
MSFHEKPNGDGAWINGGYFVLEPDVIDYIADDSTVWEQEPLDKLAQDGHLSAYKHSDFWHPMDTLRDKNYLENLWKGGNAPWKVWH